MIRERTRTIELTVAELRNEAFLALAGILEYTEGLKGFRLLVLMEITLSYAKAMGTEGREYYFPFELRRRGTYLQILSVLRRMARTDAFAWDQHGQPLSGLYLVDSMRDSAGKLYRQGFHLDEVQPILTPARPYRVVVEEQPELIRVRTRNTN